MYEYESYRKAVGAGAAAFSFPETEPHRNIMMRLGTTYLKSKKSLRILLIWKLFS
jgi:hypothetical protein